MEGGRWTGEEREVKEGATVNNPHLAFRGTDRSPKGNMWSAIPVALLSIFVTVADG